MFRCCSLETSHPRLLPQSPKVCSIHLCLFFCFVYRVKLLQWYLFKIMACSPITSWQIDGEKMKTVTDLIFLSFKTTVDNDCSLEIKRCLLLERKVMTNLESVLKSRDITLLTKVCLVKAMIFPVVTYGHESWTINKTEFQRIGAFKL